jgi:ferrous iron transport protein B
LSCHNDSGKQEQSKPDTKIRVGLAGNANVGKSVVFNQLTGLHQHVGNWPGKTVKKAEGTLVYGGYTVDVVDLPGIYSLSTYGLEEMVSREYIVGEHPDAIINVVDASSLERNLFFTTQLMELEPHLIIALNQMDVAEKKGVRIDAVKLAELIGAPVVPMTAIKNVGLMELMAEVVEMHEKEMPPVKPLRFGSEIEEIISDLTEDTCEIETLYPRRFVAVKLLEGDEEMEKASYSQMPMLREKVNEARRKIEEIHGHDAVSALTSERYANASRIASEVTSNIEPRRSRWASLEDATSHPVLGYIVMVSMVLGMFISVFTLGDYTSSLLGQGFAVLEKSYYAVAGLGPLQVFIWNGFAGGLIAGITIALPYIVPFYLALSLLEDSGYMARVAFLMDSLMHKIGLHGKGFIPIMLGFGCNVPAILASNIMETERERLICAFVSSLVPCVARSIVIMGIVATYLGLGPAAALYLIDFVIIFVLGRIAFKTLPGEPVGLIMEMPAYKLPSVKITAQRTWFRLKDFVYEAFPVIAAGNFVVYLANILGLLSVAEWVLSPVTVLWLGLPVATGVVLIFGVLRKEMTLILLASIMGTTNFALILTPAQMLVFAFVVMLYMPCIATIAVLVREFGARRAALISVIEIVVAVSLGGIIFRIFTLFGIH